MGGAKSGKTAFTLVVDQGKARVRKACAPAGRPIEDRRRKKPRRRPDYCAETDEHGLD